MQQEILQCQQLLSARCGISPGCDVTETLDASSATKISATQIFGSDQLCSLNSGAGATKDAGIAIERFDTYIVGDPTNGTVLSTVASNGK